MKLLGWTCALLMMLPVFATGQIAATPPAIQHAKSVFVSNGSADSGLFPDVFSGNADRGYSEFCAALEATGRFRLVNDPSKADLVLWLRLVAPMDAAAAQRGPRPEGFPQPAPLFRLEIYDVPTHFVLWTLTEPVGKALLQKNSDKNFDQAVQALAGDLTRMAGGGKK